MEIIFNPKHVLVRFLLSKTHHKKYLMIYMLSRLMDRHLPAQEIPIISFGCCTTRFSIQEIRSVNAKSIGTMPPVFFSNILCSQFIKKKTHSFVPYSWCRNTFPDATFFASFPSPSIFTFCRKENKPFLLLTLLSILCGVIIGE